MLKEQIADQTPTLTARRPKQGIDPNAPLPIRYEHWRDTSVVDEPEASRHRVGHSAGWHLDDTPFLTGPLPRQPYTPSLQTPQRSRVTQAYADVEVSDDDNLYVTQAAPRSAVRYDTQQGHQHRGRTTQTAAPQQQHPSRPGQTQQASPIPPRRSQQRDTEAMSTQAPPTHQRHARGSKRWLFYAGVGMTTTLALILIGNSAITWGKGVLDDWRYGNPRMYQVDAVVGHNHDSANHQSHFIALNVRGQIDVLELPAGDPTRMQVYLGPTLTSDQESVTLSFADVDHNGMPDLVIHFGDSAVVLLNKEGKFQSPSSVGQSSSYERKMLCARYT